MALVVVSPSASAAVPIGFGKSLLQLQSSNLPTTLQFGPDGRLYVGQFDGKIEVYDVARSGPGNYSVTATETITSIQSIPNHGDDGTPDPTLNTRLVTGLLVVGTTADPVIYVSSSDPRQGVIRGADLNIDTNSGLISRLTWNGSTWVREDLVRGLPRSRNVHATNGLALDQATNTLYVAQGGNTNMGAPSVAFQNLPEYALSGAILSIDLNGLGTLPYDIPTLNDPDRTGVADANDPFGGDAGKNQAVIVPGGPVQVYSPGYRNPYDLIIDSNGTQYATDNGNNAGDGGPPIGEGLGGSCTNAISEPGSFGLDNLVRVSPGYYAGHPDPTRGNAANTFAGQHPVPPAMANPIECDFQTTGADRGSIGTFPGSTNGITEYTASDFGGAMQGDLLTAEWDNYISRSTLNAAGTAVLQTQVLFSNAGTRPLDVTAQGDAGPFPGTIWMADQGASTITVFEPNDYGGATPTCTGADNASLDEDGDGYTNHDEILNGTDPCSAGDIPADADGDGISNKLDPNDDNDSMPDTRDPFALDKQNGNQTVIPVRYTWDPGSPNPGGILDSGFTGLMTNNKSNYASLFDPTKMTIGGAPGLFAVEQVPANTADLHVNNQRYGFQFGLNAKTAYAGRFLVHTALVAPFAGMRPQNDQQMGVYVGTGDQDNFVKLVVAANGGKGGVKFGREIKGVASAQRVTTVPMPGPDRVDLYLLVDPDKGTIQGSYSVTKGAVTSARVTMGNPVTVPTTWFSGSLGTAVGLSSTSKGPGPPFAALWDLIEVTPA
jgi:glucose/arabinose dehydrogenase